MLGKMIQCGGCGYTVQVDFGESGEPYPAKKIESQVNKLVVEGWRYIPSWDGFQCPKCISTEGDALYNTFFGKPKNVGKVKTYKMLLMDVSRQLSMFKELEML